MKPWFKALFGLSCLYGGLRIIARLTSEESSIDNENPYLYPNKTYVLPENMRGIGMPHKPTRDSSTYEIYLKRFMDSFASFCGLVVLSPLFILLFILIKLDDPGPAFFTQKRVGKDKAFFSLHKFRSMKIDAPHDKPTHVLDNPYQYTTRVGRFLRKTSLDELPQIWDIFRGKMSIIGPRPALWNQADLIAEREKYAANDVLPGLTGWAQINGRDELEIVDKAKLDGDYVKNISLAFDIKCFFRTIKSVVKGDGFVEGGTGEMYKRYRN